MVIKSITSNRDDHDYIYAYEAITLLKGNLYHKKKNQVNKFIKFYPNWDFRKYTNEDFDQVKNLMDRWCVDKNCSSDSNLIVEYEGTLKFLTDANLDDIHIGLLFIEDKLEGFVFGEVLNSSMLLVHIEKANAEYSGSYQMLGHAFYHSLEYVDLKWVNREQDLGIKGLRHSKMSCFPERFVEKFEIHF